MKISGKAAALVLLVALSASGAPPRRAVGRPSAPKPLPKAFASWVIDLNTSGGFAPAIRTSVTVRSTGRATLFDDRGNQTCEAPLESDELAQLNELVARSNPDAWAPSYVLPSNPTGCCDQIHTLVRLTGTTTNGEPFARETTWFDDHGPLPGDLAALHERVDGIRGRLERECAKKPLADWSIDVSEEGGVAYRFHRVTVDSSSDVAVQPNPRSSSCHYAIDGSETQQLAELVKNANPAAWAASYARADNPAGCCDQIHTTVRLTRGNAIYVTQWFSDHPELPADLVAIHAKAFAALFARFGPQCGPGF